MEKLIKRSPVRSKAQKKRKSFSYLVPGAYLVPGMSLCCCCCCCCYCFCCCCLHVTRYLVRVYSERPYLRNVMLRKWVIHDNHTTTILQLSFFDFYNIYIYCYGEIDQTLTCSRKQGTKKRGNHFHTWYQACTWYLGGCCCCWSHPTVGVALLGPSVSGRLSSREELPVNNDNFTSIIVLVLVHRNIGRVAREHFFKVVMF